MTARKRPRRAARRKAEPKELDGLCDVCARSRPHNELDDCKACGLVVCDDCRPDHEGDCCG